MSIKYFSAKKKKTVEVGPVFYELSHARKMKENYEDTKELQEITGLNFYTEHVKQNINKIDKVVKFLEVENCKMLKNRELTGKTKDIY